MAGQTATKQDVGPEDYQFVVSRAEGAAYETDGLREEFVYRDLGVAEATSGQLHAHIIRAKHLEGGHNGLHRHLLDWQFAMVLKGWVNFFYEGQGLVEYKTGDAFLVPGSTLHELRDYSDDLEILEITAPAIYDTIKADGSAMPTPGQKQRIDERIKGR